MSLTESSSPHHWSMSYSSLYQIATWATIALTLFAAFTWPQEIHAEEWQPKSEYEAQGQILEKGWPVDQIVLWREKNNSHGSYTPATGFYMQDGDKCRAVSFQFVRPDGVSFRGTGDVCRTKEGSIRFGVSRITED